MTESNNQKLFFNLINGIYDELPNENSNVVRIFLSSTFSGEIKCLIKFNKIILNDSI